MSTEEMVVTIIVAVISASGLWSYLSSLVKTSDHKDDLLLGLAHDRIMHLGMAYLERGYITAYELENLTTYLYEPYKNIGGNGSAEKIMADIYKLKIKEKS